MKKLKVIALIVAVAMVSVLMLVAFSACGPSNKFVIYNVSDYIDEEILEDFEQYYYEQTGEKIKVIYSTFETNEEMLTKMESGSANVDVICPSDYAIQRLIEKDFIQKINKDNISTYNNINPDLFAITERTFSVKGGEVADINSYYVPYMWGTVGVIYNTAKVTEADLSNDWGLLWNQAGNSNLNKEIYMKDSIRDSYLATVLYLQSSGKLPEKYADYNTQQLINCNDAEMLAAVEKALIEQKPLVKQYEVDNGKEDLAKDIGAVCLCWSGDAFYAIELAEELDLGVELAYYEPEYTNLFVDGWVITKGCKNVTAAEKFLEFLNLPEIAMRNAVYIGYTSGVTEACVRASADACAILTDAGYDPDEFFADEQRYPDAASERYGVMMDFGAKEADIVNLWKRVKAA